MYGFPDKKQAHDYYSNMPFYLQYQVVFYLFKKAFEKTLSIKDPLFFGSSKVLSKPAAAAAVVRLCFLRPAFRYGRQAESEPLFPGKKDPFNEKTVFFLVTL